MGNSRNSPFLSLKLHTILSSVKLTVALLILWQHFKGQVAHSIYRPCPFDTA